jgi:hypothetical protein
LTNTSLVGARNQGSRCRMCKGRPACNVKDDAGAGIGAIPPFRPGVEQKHAHCVPSNASGNAARARARSIWSIAS